MKLKEIKHRDKLAFKIGFIKIFICGHFNIILVAKDDISVMQLIWGVVLLHETKNLTRFGAICKFCNK